MTHPAPTLTAILDKEYNLENKDSEVNRGLKPASFHSPHAAEMLSLHTFCDDDFAVMFTETGYVVWCFDEDIKLPLAPKMSDESMAQPPASRPLPSTRRLSVRE